MAAAMTVLRAERATQPPIVFSHGNGFPAGTYRLLFEAWRRAGHDVHAIERFGHDPRYPVTSNWPHLRDELVDFIVADVAAPALLVGHSLGGMLSVLAASRRPELALGVLLLDSPVIGGWRAHSLRLAKAAGLMPRITPGGITRTRRTEWPTRGAVREHFARKAPFSRWDPRVLDDYVASAFSHHDRRSTLAFEREIEARIYETLPHHLGALLDRHPLRCPLAFIGGRDSVEARRAGIQTTQRLAGERFEWTEGTHLFPMEHPATAAALSLRMIERLLAARTQP
jgi:pimeloyl-ACP methyl ester carboxylesterase